MDFKHAKARQPEIIRTTQKDLSYSDELSEKFSELLRLTGPRNWIKYNHLTNLAAQLSYHAFASLNTLQTLGEEYTGIIQVNSQYLSLPSKFIQVLAICLEFGGHALFQKALSKLEKPIKDNPEIREEAKEKIIDTLELTRKMVPFVVAAHKVVFYFSSNKYQISKRLTNINYILIRKWLQTSHSLYGYRILGVITIFQLLVTFSITFYNYVTSLKVEPAKESKKLHITGRESEETTSESTCVLCLGARQNSSLTTCGHIFCWDCIHGWLSERDECPTCREHVKKSNVILLRNFM